MYFNTTLNLKGQEQYQAHHIAAVIKMMRPIVVMLTYFKMYI